MKKPSARRYGEFFFLGFLISKSFFSFSSSIVREVTDDKSLPKAERKRLQVVTAPGKSREAKLVKLADKLYNLRDLQRQTPIGWTEERVQQYHEWAAQVVAGLVGTNVALEKALEEVLAVKGVQIGGNK